MWFFAGRKCFLTTTLSGLVMVLGCGTDTGVPTNGGVSSANSHPAGAEKGSGKTTSAKSKQTVASTERPNIDGIPLDVFFDNPLQVAADNRTIGAPPVAVASNAAKTENTNASPEPSKPANEPTAASDAGGNLAWDKIISAELLLDEVKSIRNQLQQRLTSLQSYNSSYLEIPTFGSTLALLADVARQHSEDVRWKPKAKFIRTLSAQMVEITKSSEAKGKKSFDSVNESFLKICEILDGNDPAGLPEAADEASLEEVAKFNYLMKRLKRAEETLQNNAGSEDNFNKNLAVAAREVVVIAAIAQAIKDKSYGYDSEDEFLGHADVMRTSAKSMEKAVADKNFSEFDQLRSKVSQKCSECHMTYQSK